jgi:hypothetical protein
MNGRKHVYWITDGDIQNLVIENFGRMANNEELERIIDIILDRIPWVDAVESAIRETMQGKTTRSYSSL